MASERSEYPAAPALNDASGDTLSMEGGPRVRMLEPTVEHMQLALEAAGTGLWTWNLNDDTVSWSAECCRIHGLAPDESPAFSADYWDLVHPEDRDRLRRRIMEAVDSRRPYVCEFRIVRPAGGLTWVESRGRARYGAQGEPQLVIGTVMDVSVRRRAAEAGHAAMQAAERIELALEAGAIIGTWVWDVPADRLVADELFAKSFGLDPQACRRGMSLREAGMSVHPADRPRSREALRRALQQGGRYRCEFRVRRADGRYRWVEASGRVELDPRGKPLRLPGVLLDIEERRRVREERDAAHALLRSIIEAVPGVVYAKDREGRVIIANRGTADLIGKDLSEIIGRTDMEFLWDPAWAADIMATDRRVMETGIPVRLEECVRMRDGTQTWSLTLKEPLRNADGEVTGLVGSSINITDRIVAERALLARERELETLTDHTPDVLARFDRDLRHVFVNLAAQEQVGLPASEIVGRTWSELGMPPQLADLWDRHIREVFVTGTTGRMEFTAPRDGSESYWSCLLVPEFDEHGAVESVLAVAHDVTERVRLEQQLREQDHRKDVFLATLGHELRNPLAPISSSLAVMRRMVDAPDPRLASRTLDILDRQLRRLVHLVNDLLDIARIRQDKVRLQLEELTVDAIVDAAVESCRPLLDEGRHPLSVRVADAGMRVMGDQPRLVQVLSNMLVNAGKYSDAGTPIGVWARAEKGWAVISVEDSGIGIPRHMLPRVWDMFEQANSTVERSQGGLGIGLALVRKITEMHGGSVEADSPGSGQGSTFTVRLPLLR